MKIAPNKVVVMHYSVSDSEGTLIDSSYDHQPLSIIHGIGFLIPGLENALVDKQTGDTFEVAVKADEAYGERHDGFVQTVPKEMFADIDDLQVGTQLRATTEEGEQTVIVVDVSEDSITVDGNHPLAGIDLQFDVEILEVRDATKEELEHGHVHSKKSCCDSNSEESCCD
ncbi:FKBP-type peptidyl-prolyl cis-trans isomerase [Thalassotalea agarivorans]|uniref:Peptidyl-prolyl cis-trans isomerase n=1 Tax=Thalassotalea agarivorans TaxID=349064 RepID=A0A1I0FY27_THASX|nr:peptidylprolyl isomerase [Thalassotalea agarivorans]SET63200.1 FKBP-type peptidyl-prolyl cis-trans isomerase SlyD [Thalassotalea agarivorans]